MKVKLSVEEIAYLKLSLLQEKDEFDVIFKNVADIICIDENTADDIRDWASEKLQIVGFDKNYNLTDEGKILEKLIDKFFH